MDGHEASQCGAVDDADVRGRSVERLFRHEADRVPESSLRFMAPGAADERRREEERRLRGLVLGAELKDAAERLGCEGGDFGRHDLKGRSSGSVLGPRVVLIPTSTPRHKPSRFHQRHKTVSSFVWEAPLTQIVARSGAASRSPQRRRSNAFSPRPRPRSPSPWAEDETRLTVR